MGSVRQKAGNHLRRRLTEALRGYEMVKEVRGMGLLMGIEFQAPKQLRLRIPYEAFCAVHAGLFGQIVVMRLFRDFGFLTQVCANNFMLLKIAPPLVVRNDPMDSFVDAVKEVVQLADSPGAFWSEALGLMRRAFHS
ncbi:MAG: aminotransferase class III-fold pyridoxal phosphate-dependent enzyme [Candidatus Sulfotelmatobacter sp.]